MIAAGSLVPNVSVAAADGTIVSLASDFGAPALFLFFKGSCGTCEVAMPVLQHWKEHAPEVSLIGVSQDSVADTDQFFADNAIEMDVLYDREGMEASSAFDLEGVPTLALIEDGTVSWISVGWNRDQIEDLDARLKEISGRSVALEGIDALPSFRPG